MPSPSSPASAPEPTARPSSIRPLPVRVIRTWWRLISPIAKQFPIAIGDGAAITPDIDAGAAVWVQENPNGNLDVRGRDVESVNSFLVAGGDDNEVAPAISGSRVAYVTGPKEVVPGSVMTLKVVDLNDNSVITLDSAPVGAGSGGFLRPTISGDRVVWARLEQVGNHVVHWQLKTRRLGRGFHIPGR